MWFYPHWGQAFPLQLKDFGYALTDIPVGVSPRDFKFI